MFNDPCLRLNPYQTQNRVRPLSSYKCIIWMRICYWMNWEAHSQGYNKKALSLSAKEAVDWLHYFLFELNEIKYATVSSTALFSDCVRASSVRNDLANINIVYFHLEMMPQKLQLSEVALLTILREDVCCSNDYSMYRQSQIISELKISR